MSPVSSSSLQAAWGSGFVTVLPAGAYVWTIRSTDSGYTCVFFLPVVLYRQISSTDLDSIQDGGVSVFWGVDHANSDAQVTITGGTGGEKQRWILESA